jgi:hypothetical protein
MITAVIFMKAAYKLEKTKCRLSRFERGRDKIEKPNIIAIKSAPITLFSKTGLSMFDGATPRRWVRNSIFCAGLSEGSAQIFIFAGCITEKTIQATVAASKVVKTVYFTTPVANTLISVTPCMPERVKMIDNTIIRILTSLRRLRKNSVIAVAYWNASSELE